VLAPELPYAGSQVWSSDFLPGCHQGMRVLAGAEPVPDLARRSPSPQVQEMELSLLDKINRRHQQRFPTNPDLAARIKSYETAFGMQMEMPDVLDLSKETDATLALYGLERGSTKGFAWQCLVARRMAERGVRVVELFDVGSNTNWDSHNNIDDHVALARNVDRPIAALVADLKQRGLLDETLIVGCSEFGRTPWQDLTPRGRGHHSRCFTCFLVGGGVKGGFSFGVSDEYGDAPAQDPVHVHDFHATILHLMGLDHTRLTYRYSGRDFRLTDVYGEVVSPVIA
jgi:hypothetical protein